MTNSYKDWFSFFDEMGGGNPKNNNTLTNTHQTTKIDFQVLNKTSHLPNNNQKTNRRRSILKRWRIKPLQKFKQMSPIRRPNAIQRSAPRYYAALLTRLNSEPVRPATIARCPSNSRLPNFYHVVLLSSRFFTPFPFMLKL